MIKNIVILALLGLFAWQHSQDTNDRQTILSDLQRNGQQVHLAYKPCATNSINNHKGDSVESPEIQEQ